MAFIEIIPKRIILASASPRRRELFKLIFETFETVESNVDENIAPATKPHELVIELQEHARRMLIQLSDRYHKVLTGFSICQMPEERYVEDFEETLVKFRKLDEWEIQRYLRVGHPLDKAGAYGIQNEAALFVERIEGCYYNVMGLPVARLFKTLCPLLNNLCGDKND